MASTTKPSADGEFPPFPSSEIPPSTAELAELVARGMPPGDRAAAARLLIDEILPWDLRDLPTDPRATPKPRAIVHAVYGTLTTRLGEIPRHHRLAWLSTTACRQRGDRITGRATALAVARYVADHGRPRTNLVVGYLDEARPYLAMTPEQLQAEAERIDGDIMAFEHDAQRDTACFAMQRISVLQARYALGAARTGQFDPAMGALYVFLRNAGAKPHHFDPR